VGRSRLPNLALNSGIVVDVREASVCGNLQTWMGLSKVKNDCRAVESAARLSIFYSSSNIDVGRIEPVDVRTRIRQPIYVTGTC
jgi:hypothetical protein